MESIKILTRYIKILFKAKYIWKKPPRKNILLFDRKGSSRFFDFIEEEDCNILEVRGESLNIIVIVTLLLKFKKINYSNYIEQYLLFVKPKYVFHNSFNSRFFKLPKNKLNFVTVFTQSELSNEYDKNNFLENKGELEADFLFVWGDIMKELYKKYVKGKYIVTGSFRNNFGPKINQKDLEPKIAYVSQYRPLRKSKSEGFIHYHNMKFTYEQHFLPDTDVALMLKNFCLEKKINLEIAGTSLKDKEGEINFFTEKLGNSGWNYLESQPDRRGHYLTSNAKFVVTVDSTLGYECLARGQRVVFFSIRGKYIGYRYSWFGWPAELAEEGPCWTTLNSEEDFKRLINFLVYGSDSEWENVRRKYLDNIISYDYDNSIFKNFLKKHNIKLRKKFRNFPHFDR